MPQWNYKKNILNSINYNLPKNQTFIENENKVWQICLEFLINKLTAVKKDWYIGKKCDFEVSASKFYFIDILTKAIVSKNTL